jgi:hypothetical protein
MKPLALLLLVACSSGPPLDPRTNPPDQQRTLADEVVRLTASSCATCHSRSSPKADPDALAVFDYDRPDWPSMLSEERLDKFRGRARGSLDEAGQKTLDAFIAGELGLRRQDADRPLAGARAQLVR